MSEKILLCFHNNFLNNDLGCNSYIFEIARYLKNAGCIVDFFSLTTVWNNFDNFAELNSRLQMIDNLYLYTPNPAATATNKLSPGFEQRCSSTTSVSFLGLPLFTRRTITHQRRPTSEPEREFFFSWLSPDTVDYFQKIIDDNQYDTINIHYLQMAEIIRHINRPEKTRLIYSAHDAFYMMEGYLPHGLNQMLHIMPQEIAVMKLFDEVLFISNDEKTFFERLIPGTVTRHFPHALSPKILPPAPKDIDVLFLGFANPHNLGGMIWFIDEVMPHLNPKIKTTICGRVWWSFARDAPEYMVKAEKLGIQRIDFAEDLDELYARTKLSICPLLSGTGMKIKTIDSLARGIPVVSTTWGVDGFADKHNNGCLVSNDPAEFARMINLLISDRQSYDELVEEGRLYFDKYLSLEANAPTLDAAFELNQPEFYGKR